MSDFNWDDYLIDDMDPQSAVAAQGLKTLGKGALNVIGDGPMPSGFQDPRQTEPGLETPAFDPVDIIGGGIASVAGKVAPKVAGAIMSGLEGAEFGNVVGNEIGAVGRHILKRNAAKKAAKLPAGFEAVHVGGTGPTSYRILDREGKIAGYGKDPTAALEDLYRVQPELRPNPKSGGRYSSKVISPGDEPVTIGEIKKKDLAFFDPEQFDSVVVNKNKAGDVRGSLGLDENNRTLSIKVDPKHQGKGVASSLYEQALKDKGVIRSSTIDQQLEGGQGLWKKFAEENPHHVRQARDPDTLKPKPYKVWEAETNVPLRKKEMELETKIDALRDKYHSSSENLELNPIAVKLRDEYTKAHDLLMEADSKFIELSNKHGFHTNESSRGRTGIKELDEAAAKYQQLSKLKSDISKQFNTAANKSKDPKEELQKQIDKLIKEHKAVNKKSGHTMYNLAGPVGAASLWDWNKKKDSE